LLLGLTGGQKPGFFARILRQDPQQRQKPGFFSLVSLVWMRNSPYLLLSDD
jgi:hypothetical protein